MFVTPSPISTHIKRDMPSKTNARKRLKFENTDGSTVAVAVDFPKRSREIGEPEGHCTAKKAIVWDGTESSKASTVAASYQTGEENLSSTEHWNKHYFNTLYYSHNLLDHIEYGAGLDERDRGCINLRGFQVHFNALNASKEIGTELHVAMVRPQFGRAGTGNDMKTDFFRHYTNNRARDFNVDAAPFELSGIEMCHNPINTDRFTVLFHQKMWLGSGSQSWSSATEPLEPFRSRGGIGSDASPNFALRQYWVPIEKQIRYTNPTVSTSVAEGDDIRLVWWFANPFSYPCPSSAFSAMDTPNQNEITNAYKCALEDTDASPKYHPCIFMSRVIAYFRDPDP